MSKYKVIMVCKESWRAEAEVVVKNGTSLEKVKDIAWSKFDKLCSNTDLEQENDTKVVLLSC